MEAKDFGPLSVTKNCKLELFGLLADHLEPQDVVVKVIKSAAPIEVQENTAISTSYQSSEIHGLKHCNITFGKQVSTHKIHCGPDLNVYFTVSLRLYY